MDETLKKFLPFDVDKYHITREKILAFERLIAQCPQEEIPLQHHFSTGLYARQITIPPGMVLVGKIHKHPHINIVNGDISVVTEDGIRRITGFAVIESPAGVKRAGYTHAETVWITVHATEETDLEKIEEHFIAPSYEEFDALKIKPLVEDFVSWNGKETMPSLGLEMEENP
jgi:hypothetical protein